MAINQRKRQKQLAKKKAKRKSAVAGRRAGTGFSGILSRARMMAAAAKAPIHQCLVPVELFEKGIGDIVISKKMPDGDIAVSRFLLDVFCLGVKNAFFVVITQEEFNSQMEMLDEHQPLENIHPTCVRKLIENCVDYADALGFHPHPDYKIAKEIFGDIEAGACPQKYEFGKDGMPWYISGPHETPEKSQSIINRLRKKCGEDGFHYIVNIGSDMNEL
ncbi:MAG: hypothetical protein GY862_39735 [Gammaproteobacteria bacterium]|nr:hypothetical protein [Gammaproteobacteria bacterium]